MRQRLISGLVLLVLLAPAGARAENEIPQQPGLANNSRLGNVFEQPDGKLVAVGYTAVCRRFKCFKKRVVMARYDARGRLDTSFGDRGVALGPYVLDFVGLRVDFEQVLLTPQGALLFAGDRIYHDGSSHAADERDFLLVRFTPDGRLDSSFGGDGVVKADLGYLEHLEGAAVDPAGGVIALGEKEGDFLLARFTPDGQLDPAFGEGGVVQTDLAVAGPGSGDAAEAVAFDAPGRILATGRSRWCSEITGCDTGLLVARYEPDGDLDLTFGGDGIGEPAFVGRTPGYPFPAFVRADAALRPVIAGIASVGDSSTGLRSAFARYTEAGILDPTFAGTGQVTGACTSVFSFEPSGDGFDAAGDGCREHLNSDGTVEPALMTSLWPRPRRVRAAVAAATSRGFVAAGWIRIRQGRYEPPFRGMALMRYRPDGTLDPAFGQDGMVLTPRVPRCRGELPTLLGSTGRDVLTGTSRADVIITGAGGDHVRASRGPDLVCAGSGNDVVLGGLGPDVLAGQTGGDRLVGGRGRDRTLGGPGRDSATP